MRKTLSHSVKFTISAFFLLVVSAISISAATFTVTNTANSGAGSLRQAVTDSNAPGSDTIVFDPAVFNTPQTIQLANAILISTATGESLTITGPGANLLTIRGNGAADGTGQIFSRNSNTSHALLLSGMTLTNAGFSAVDNDFSGAQSSLTVTNVVFAANADGFGGGAISNAATLTVTSCTFTNNVTSSGGGSGSNGGGAINSSTNNVNIPVIITGSTFTGNTANSTFAGSGGAINNRSGSMTITNSTFTNNSARSGGGAVNNGEVLSISGSTFTGNSTVGNAPGGAVSSLTNSPGQLTITNSVINKNSAVADGGGVYAAFSGTTNITNTTISNNTANSDNDTNGDGGGLYFRSDAGTVTVSGSTINGNQAFGNSTSAGSGGGINVSTALNLTNSTVSGNIAGRNGGGIYDSESGGGTDIVNINSSTIVINTATGNGGGYYINSGNPAQNNFRNTIIATNTASGGTSQDIFGTTNSLGYNLFRNTTGASITGTTTGNQLGVDPRIDGVLRSNGGATKTHALRRTSPALNAADPANVLATDQRGFPRPGAGLTLPDIGAYERQSNDLVVPAAFDFDDDGRADLSVFRANSDPAFADFQIRKSSDNLLLGYSWGLPGDKLAPADYDGDGKTDVAVWRESEGNFYVLNSANGTLRQENFGLTGDVLTVGDWDGDTKADTSVYRNAAQSNFFYRGSLNNPLGNTTYYPFGITGDIPMRGDYDGDGKQDAAVFRASNNIWYIRQSSDGSVRYESWGLASDTFVPADYDGDGKTDLAVFRSGIWYIKQSTNNQPRYVYFGLSSDKLIPADYDGDGKADVAIFRNGVWYISQSINGLLITQFGLSDDLPVPGSYINQ